MNHLYDVEVVTTDGKKYIEIKANNRTQAAAIARKMGYEVCSVNMLG